MNSQERHQALDPRSSIIVEACAGSGKTWLLVSRVIRLLLSGTKPSEILCITFMRKAAEEMRARLTEWLEFLAKASEDEVITFLIDRGIEEEKAKSELNNARHLFEKFLLASPTITLTTFHGWFTQIVQSAPLNYGTGGAFNLSENTQLLIAEAWQGFVQSTQKEPEGDAAQALTRLFAEYDLSNTKKLLLSFLNARGEWWAYSYGNIKPIDHTLNHLLETLDVDADKNYFQEFIHHSSRLGEFLEYAKLLDRNTDKDKAIALKLFELIEKINNHTLIADQTNDLISVFFTGKEEPRVRKASGAQEKRLTPQGEERLLSLHEKLCDEFQVLKKQLIHQKIYQLNRDSIQCGVGVIDYYQQLKSSRQLTDFVDLEWLAFQLIHHSGSASTIQYKLDSRYKHILLDEFQDTNPTQWLILKSWLDESIGAGSPPSVFLVGDPKQSIYRFRKADARLFYVARDYLVQNLQAYVLDANVSWRCSPAVIEAVNRVFEGKEHFSLHAAHQQHLSGAVKVIPMDSSDTVAQGSSELSGLRNPLKEALLAKPSSARDIEGAQIAETISQLVGKVEITERDGTKRPAEYRDCLILKRSRKDLDKYEDALRRKHIPYISARRGSLLETLEVQDLTSLLEFLISPVDSLKLAHTLRSPIFNCSDEDLCQLAIQEGNTWWKRLSLLIEHSTASPNLMRAKTLLEGWLKLVDRLPVHDLLDRIFFEGNIEEHYHLAAPLYLQAAVKANLQALMTLALETDSGRYPSLPRFLNELADFRMQADDEAPDEGTLALTENAVRIMTIHGAKGLEAPIVFIADANALGKGSNTYEVISNWSAEAVAPSHFSVFSTTAFRGKAREIYFDEEKQIEEKENWNLLYVAMTRAKQLLVVSAAASEREGQWYKAIAHVVEGIENDLPIIESSTESTIHEVSGLLIENYDSESLIIGTRQAVEQSKAANFGIHFHALLEKMTIEGNVSDEYLISSIQHQVSQTEYKDLFDEVVSIIKSPQLNRFFDAKLYERALNEIEYVNVQGEIRRIDRLVEFPEEIWILDYKTGIVDSGVYEQQLYEYRDALMDIYRNKTIHCGLIFQDGAFIELA